MVKLVPSTHWLGEVAVVLVSHETLGDLFLQIYVRLGSFLNENELGWCTCY